MNTLRILIAGIGNLFMGDDAFGCEVATRLAQVSLPEEVRVVDFGIRSLDLTYALLDAYEKVILIDAMPRGQTPGTLYLVEPEMAALEGAMVDGHTMDPVKVLAAAAAMGGRVDHVVVVGCEPVPRDPDADWEMGLSQPVQAAVAEAVMLVASMVNDFLGPPVAAASELNGGMDHESLNIGGYRDDSRASGGSLV